MPVTIQGSPTEYATIRAALRDAVDGDTLIVTEGVYNENIRITQENLTILGPQAGVPGDDPARGTGEAIIEGITQVRADGVTIDGLSLTSVGGNTGANDRLIDARGPRNDPAEDFTARNLVMEVGTNRAGELMFGIEARDGFTLEDSSLERVVTGTPPGLSRAMVRVGQGDNVTITGNVISDGYIFVQSGDGANTTTGIEITGNEVDQLTDGAAIIVTGPRNGDLPGEITPGSGTLDVSGNTINDPAGILVRATSGDDDLSDLQSDAEDSINAGDGNDTLDGGRGNDSLTGGDGDDVFRISDGGGSDTIADFDADDDDGDGRSNDQLDLTGLTDANGDPVTVDDVVVSGDPDGNAVLTFPNGEQAVLQGIGPDEVDERALLVGLGVPCFTPGTYILTETGERAVETLRAGDAIRTRDHGVQCLLWVGESVLHAGHLAQAPHLRPVHVPAGALGNVRAMRVSPQHAIVANAHMPGLAPQDHGAVFVRAAHLVGLVPGIRVARGVQQVRYIHLLFDRHEIVFADGISCESFHPGKQALASMRPEARRALLKLRPDLAAGPAREMDRVLPLLTRKDLRDRILTP